MDSTATLGPTSVAAVLVSASSGSTLAVIAASSAASSAAIVTATITEPARNATDTLSTETPALTAMDVLMAVSLAWTASTVPATTSSKKYVLAVDGTFGGGGDAGQRALAVFTGDTFFAGDPHLGSAVGVRFSSGLRVVGG